MAAFSAASTVPVRVRGEEARAGLRRRLIRPEAGRALEILGHAIEYLADEYAHRGGSFSAHDGEVEALQLLMGLNREIYLECPEAPSMSERWRDLLHPRVA